MIPASKRQRIYESQEKESSNEKHTDSCEMKASKLYSKVICQKDYLFSICLFLKMENIIKLFPLYYHHFIMNF